jgi:hypothetical protein
MCWFSAEHANHIAEAKAGQRLGIRKVYPHSNWAVSESELEGRRPTPVCLLDGTKVLFRVSGDQQPLLHLGAEAVAVFRMLRHPKRDVFEFSDGRQLTVDELPPGMIFDVLMVPGLEQLSAILDPEPVAQKQKQEEQQKEKEPFLARLMARL